MENLAKDNLVKDNSQDQKNTPKFNLSSYLTPTTIHIAVEVILACIFFVYFNRKINNQKTEYETRIATLESEVKKMNELLTSLLTNGEEHQQVKSTKLKETVIAPKEFSKPIVAEVFVQPPNMAMNFFQEFMQGSGVDQLLNPQTTKPEQLSSITELEEEEPVSREQLDKELTEELNDLNPS